MRSEQINTPEEATIYLTECTMATIDDFCMKSKPPVGEFKRQVLIAQTGMDWIKQFKSDTSKSGRVDDVKTKFENNVTNYALKLRKKWHPNSKPIFN
jgi:hypothetical protein